MEEILRQALLYDFYGELLTGHQKRVYEEVVLNDYSFSEVAEDLGISRQGVHDLIKRCNHILEDYENKLHLVERFNEIRKSIRRMNELAEDESIGQESLREEIKRLSDGILKAL